MRVGALIGWVLFLGGCGTSPHSASHSTTSRPVSITSTTTSTSTSVPYAGPKLTSIGSVSCADATHCWAGASAGTSGDESAILATTDGGQSWAVQDVIPGVNDIDVDCPSDTHCLAVENRSASNEPPLLSSTTDGGASWSTQPVPTEAYAVEATSCVNDLDCWLVAAQPQTENDLVIATTNWGGSWTVQDRSSIGISNSVSYGISCPSTSDCVVVGIGALTTSNGGTTWQKHPVPGELNVVSCPSASLCVAGADVTSAIPANESTVIATSDDGGSSWHDVETVGGDVGVLGSLSCPTTTDCVAVGNGYTYTSGGPPNGQYTLWGAVATSADGGKTWNRIEEPQASNLFGLSCATDTTDCVAVGYWAPAREAVGGPSSTGVILRTVDDGSTWTEEPLP